MTSRRVTALRIRTPARSRLDPDMRRYFEICEDKIGHVPNVLLAYSAHGPKLRNMANFYNELMLGESPLSKLEREMIAVVVSSANHCYYCLVAHGAAVRCMSMDPALGELLASNYRAATLSRRHRAMLDFAHRLTVNPDEVGEEDRRRLRRAGFGEEAIWDIAEVAAFFNFTNRLATATDMMPNDCYHAQCRG
ncbi:MAG: peroxidase-related enzyme [Steroidobacteraceae bacterium]